MNVYAQGKCCFPAAVPTIAVAALVIAGKDDPERIESWMPRPLDVAGNNAYGVRVTGDSMAPAYPMGSVAVCSSRCKVEDHDEAYVSLRDESMLRIVHFLGSNIALESYNTWLHPPVLMNPDNVRSMDMVMYVRRHEATN